MTIRETLIVVLVFLLGVGLVVTALFSLDTQIQLDAKCNVLGYDGSTIRGFVFTGEQMCEIHVPLGEAIAKARGEQ